MIERRDREMHRRHRKVVDTGLQSGPVAVLVVIQLILLMATLFLCHQVFADYLDHQMYRIHGVDERAVVTRDRAVFTIVSGFLALELVVVLAFVAWWRRKLKRTLSLFRQVVSKANDLDYSLVMPADVSDNRVDGLAAHWYAESRQYYLAIRRRIATLQRACDCGDAATTGQELAVLRQLLARGSRS